MHVASLELCKELFELSAWKDTNYSYVDNEQGVFYSNPTPREHLSGPLPAYDLGYLLRKLPQTIGTIDDGDEESLVLGAFSFDGSWYAEYGSEYSTKAGTPEDALCLLAVELKKQGILT